MQLDLFEDAPRFYHLALERLAHLDMEGCRSALESHRRSFPGGPDPLPVLEASFWLEERLPDPNSALADFGQASLHLARDLREGRGGGGFRLLAPGVVRDVVSSLARGCVARAASEGLEPASAVTEDLPWGAFHLLARRWGEAETHLGRFLSGGSGSPAAYAALGDARWCQGRREAALLAYREACALDPSFGGWAVECEPLKSKRSSFQSEGEWSAGWWAVGAYLEGFFPPFGRAPAAELRKRWQRYAQLRERLRSEAEVGPQVFLAGLFLSENADTVLGSGEIGLEAVRRLLSELHPEAWERHWEALGS